MTQKKAYYAVWGNTRGIKPGVYWANFDLELRPLLKRTSALYHLLGTTEADRLRGLDLLETKGYPWTRQSKPKAEAMHRRCWYCACEMDIASFHTDESAEDEHQVPQWTKWRLVDRSENIVVSCRACNGDKSGRDVPAFRDHLARQDGERVMFYGDVLRFVRDSSPAFGWIDRTLMEAEAAWVLSWYEASKGVRLHSWREDLSDYASGLLLPIPADVYPFALGAPERLIAIEAPPRAKEPSPDWDDGGGRREDIF